MTPCLTKTLPALLALLVAARLCSAAPAGLAQVRKKLGLPDVADATNTVTITDGTNAIAFRPGYRGATLNGVAIWLNGPAEEDLARRMTISQQDLSRFLAPIRAGGVTRAGAGAFRVFLDPGHGGDDCGAVSKINGQAEKDLVLDISLRVGALLLDAGVDVSFSRTNDVFVTLDERSEMAKRKKADAFVSIHANFAAGSAARGTETFTLTLAGFDSTSGPSSLGNDARPGNAFDAGSSLLGFFIHRTLPGRRGPADRGLRHARFQVLRQAPCPAVLVECGFLSNRDETASLASPRFREKTARAIARGILDFIEGTSAK